MQEGLIKPAEVGRRLGLGQREVYRLAKTGRLPSVRFGPRAIRFRPEDVDAFISAHLDYAGVAAALDGGAA